MAESSENPQNADSAASYIDDVRQAIAKNRSEPWRIVTPKLLRKAKIRAWRHRFQERYVQHLIHMRWGR